MDQKGVEGEEPEEETRRTKWEPRRYRARTYIRISASSSSAALRYTRLIFPPVFFISELSEMRRPRLTFRTMVIPQAGR